MFTGNSRTRIRPQLQINPVPVCQQWQAGFLLRRNSAQDALHGRGLAGAYECTSVGFRAFLWLFSSVLSDLLEIARTGAASRYQAGGRLPARLALIETACALRDIADRLTLCG